MSTEVGARLPRPPRRRPAPTPSRDGHAPGQVDGLWRRFVPQWGLRSVLIAHVDADGPVGRPAGPFWVYAGRQEDQAMAAVGPAVVIAVYPGRAEADELVALLREHMISV